VELGAPAAFARIVWHWDDSSSQSPGVLDSCPSMAPALKLPIALPIVI
jgi:hypothetical protein